MLDSEYTDYNLIMATTFGMPINGSIAYISSEDDERMIIECKTILYKI